MKSLKQLTFGVEVEFGCNDLEKVKRAVARVLRSDDYEHGDTRLIAPDGRVWSFVHDGSISGFAYGAEFVTPILKYEDLDLFQECVRAIRQNGGKVNTSCGLHVHVGAEDFTPSSLRTLMNVVANKEDLLYAAAGVNRMRLERWAQPADQAVLAEVNRVKPKTKEQLAMIWYGVNSRQGLEYSIHQHYHPSRYHLLNLHSYFYRGTVEYRLFNGSLHAGQIKAYVVMCLAISADALNRKFASVARPTVSDNQKYTFRTWVIRIGLNGEEFKNVRKHWADLLEGNPAWRYGTVR